MKYLYKKLSGMKMKRISYLFVFLYSFFSLNGADIVFQVISNNIVAAVQHIRDILRNVKICSSWKKTVWNEKNAYIARC